MDGFTTPDLVQTACAQQIVVYLSYRAVQADPKQLAVRCCGCIALQHVAPGSTGMSTVQKRRSASHAQAG